MLSVENIKIKKIDINLPEEFKHIKLPDLNRETISFEIKNSNTAVANSIRRVVNGELEVNCFYLEEDNIDTNEEYIIKSELVKRIRHIPILQETNETKFTLNINNTTTEKIVVYSSNIVPKICSSDFRLCQLRPGKYINITITTKKGYGYEYSCYGLTSNITYKITDYTIVSFAGPKDIQKKRVKTTELIDLIKKNKLEYDSFKRILIVDKNYVKDKIKDFDIILEENIKTYQNTEIYCRDFYLEIETYGNIDSITMMHNVCNNIINRIKTILHNMEIETDTLSIISLTEKTSIKISGEDYTIGELIRKTIYELNPSISLINTTIEHPLQRSITINIRYTEPLVIFKQACEKIITQFEYIKSCFKS